MEPYKLTGIWEMLQATGAEGNRIDFLMRLDRLVGDDGEVKETLPSEDSQALFYAFRETGANKYKKAMELVLKAPDLSLTALPLAAAYDTAFCKKEHYNELTEHFRDGRAASGDGLIAMVRTVEELSPEIYEYYRELRDLTKEAVKKNYASLHVPCLADPDQLKTAYCVLKACSLRVLQAEKYKSFFQTLEKAEKARVFDCAGGIGQMIKAQSILLKKQEV